MNDHIQEKISTDVNPLKVTAAVFLYFYCNSISSKDLNHVSPRLISEVIQRKHVKSMRCQRVEFFNGAIIGLKDMGSISAAFNYLLIKICLSLVEIIMR